MNEITDFLMEKQQELRLSDADLREMSGGRLTASCGHNVLQLHITSLGRYCWIKALEALELSVVCMWKSGKMNVDQRHMRQTHVVWKNKMAT